MFRKILAASAAFALIAAFSLATLFSGRCRQEARAGRETGSGDGRFLRDRHLFLPVTLAVLPEAGLLDQRSSVTVTDRPLRARHGLTAPQSRR